MSIERRTLSYVVNGRHALTPFVAGIRFISRAHRFNARMDENEKLQSRASGRSNLPKGEGKKNPADHDI